MPEESRNAATLVAIGTRNRVAGIDRRTGTSAASPTFFVRVQNYAVFSSYIKSKGPFHW